jgi:hypothetical protein
MKKLNFGPDLYVDTIDQNLLNDLIDLGKVQTENMKHRLVGQIENEFSFNEDSKKKLLPGIETYIRKYINEITKEKSLISKKVNLKLKNLWINYQKAGEYNPPHVHTGHISFVIYLDFPKEILEEKSDTQANPPGSISFYYGSDQYFKTNTDFETYLTKLLYPTTEINLVPQTGQIYIFPAYLLHYVQRFKNEDVIRISVSGNFDLEKSLI